MPLEVTVLRQTGSALEDAPDSLARLVEMAANAAAAAVGYTGPRTEVSVVLTDDETISRYHGQYLGDDNPTDVISFPAARDSGEPAISGGPVDKNLGDIIVSEDTARVQAAQYGHSVEREISLLVIHGVLHLVGYDDYDDESRAKMREMENKALALLE